MLEFLRRIYHTHRFFANQLLYPLLLSSAVAGALFAGRVYLSHSRSYIFLNWNLFLAWIPYGCGLWAAYLQHEQPGRWWLLLLPAAIWAIFFPNAPYLITDFVHLKERAPISFWYDLGMLATFAWTGCLLAIVSLNTMQSLVQNYLGRIAGWAFAGAMLGAGGLGVYIGRILRWNSWDLVFQPRIVLLDVAEQMLNNQLRTFGFAFIFSALLFACYWTFTSLQKREQV
jgi:uncharacterized membrane protein